MNFVLSWNFQEGNDSDEEEEGDEEGSEEDATDAGDLEDTQKAAKFGWFDDLFVFDTGETLLRINVIGSHLLSLSSEDPDILLFKWIADVLCRCAWHLRRTHEIICFYSQIFGNFRFSWLHLSPNLMLLRSVTLSWSHPVQLNKSGPTRRAAHSTCAVSNKLVIFGGRDPTARRNDLHVFNIGNLLIN